MLALRTSTSLSALGLVIGIAGTSWLTALTYERAPATRPLAEVVMPTRLPKPVKAHPLAPSLASAPATAETAGRPRVHVSVDRPVAAPRVASAPKP